MFEIWPLCKMASLGHTIKLRKACEKRLYKHIRGSVWVKRLGKTANIQKNKTILKSGKIGQIGSNKIVKSMREAAPQAH